MIQQEKRQVGEDLASEAPENPNPCEVHSQSASEHAMAHCAEFPRQAFLDSESWHRAQLMHATSVGAVKHHTRHMIIRHAAAMRGVHDGWPDYYSRVVAASVATSPVGIRFRQPQLRALCHAAIEWLRGQQ
jgi:hypothetical protein